MKKEKHIDWDAVLSPLKDEVVEIEAQDIKIEMEGREYPLFISNAKLSISNFPWNSEESKWDIS